VWTQQVLEKLREPNITIKTAEKKIEEPFYSVELYNQKYSDFIREVNEFNGLELAEEFNNLEKGNFVGNYIYPKELYSKDLNIGMKTILEENGIALIHLYLFAEYNNAHHNLLIKNNILTMLNFFTGTNIFISITNNM
jgi:hypothetical protein